MKYLAGCLCFLLFAGFCHASPVASPIDTNLIKTFNPYTKQYIALIAGIHYSFYTFGEIGIGENYFTLIGDRPVTTSKFISSEFRLDKKLIIGPKIGAWIDPGFSALCAGADLICYTDTHHTAWRFRPQAGFGIDHYKLVYGYNIALSHKDFAGINRHCFSLVIAFGLKNKKALKNL